MAYLDANPPRIQQFRCPRRQRPSGIIGVHTAESFPDETGPDTGAENVAAFIARRTNHGSYHLLADSDSIIQLVEFRCVAYHIGTHGLNEHTIGISAATQAAKWNSLGAGYRDAMVRNMARAAARAARWLQEHYDITVPARRITLAQALRGERGFLAHGDADPDRRTDPGKTFPWDDFLAYYAEEMDDMPTAKEIADEILDQVLTKVDETSGSGPRMRVRNFLRWIHEHAAKSRGSIEQTLIPQIAAIRSEQAANRELLVQLAAQQSGVALTEEQVHELATRIAEAGQGACDQVLERLTAAGEALADDDS